MRITDKLPQRAVHDETVIGRERIIEDAIMASPERLGYPGALAIRNWRVAPTCGRLDVGLLPIKGTKQLILVEAKAADAPDAASKVVGQLLMYYAGALTLGSKGLACLRAFAENKTEACNTSKKSMILLSGGIGPTPAAWAKLSSGKPLSPTRLGLFVALDNEPSPFLRSMLVALRSNHDLSIGLVIVRNRVIEVVEAPVSRNGR
jgi:hypothetical protein